MNGRGRTRRREHPAATRSNAAGSAWLAALGLLLCWQAPAQPGWVIDTIAGSDIRYDGPATAALIAPPVDVAVDGSGNVYMVDTRNSRVRKVDATTGRIETIAGSGMRGYGGDGGPATTALLDQPYGVAVDGSGNVYVADTQNHRVRRIDAATGTIETVAGAGRFGYGGDGGPATAALLAGPEGVAVDGSGNVYVADSGNHRVRRIDAATGGIETLAGTGAPGYGGDGGPATAALLDTPRDVAVDGSGDVYVADTGNGRVRRIDVAAGTIETLATGLAPEGVAVDGSGDVYVVEGNRVRRIDAATGTVESVAGAGRSGYEGDGGAATAALLARPEGVAVDGSGDVYVADTSNGRVRRIDVAAGTIETVAGAGFGDRGPALAALLHHPRDVAVDDSGNVYVADTNNHRVRRIDAARRTIDTFAGIGVSGYGGDGGPATAASFSWPRGMAVDGSGNVYVADTNNHRVRRIDAATGRIETVAGSGERGYGGDDGPATAASFDQPYGVAVDDSGNVYVADALNHRVRRIDAGGRIETLAGTGTPGDGGDGGPATAALLENPRDVAVDGSGNVYVADSGNGRVRRIDVASGAIETVATGLAPEGVAVADSGDVYVADWGNHRIRRIDAGGAIHAFAGNGAPGYGGDGGSATAGSFNQPYGVAVDDSGYVYVADARNNRVRKLTPDNEPPRDLAARVVAGAVAGTSEVILTWTPSTNRTYVRQRVMRRQQGQAWAEVAELAVRATIWTDQSVVAGGSYFYAVRGEKANGKGTRSNQVSVRVEGSTPPGGSGDGDVGDGDAGDNEGPPRDLAATVVAGAVEVSLTWTPSANRAYVRQHVMRRQQGQAWADVAELGVEAATWTDRGVVLGEKYLYAVRAEKADGEGSRSGQVSVRVRHSTPPGGDAGDGDAGDAGDAGDVGDGPPRDLAARVVARGTVEVSLTWTPSTNPDYVVQYVKRRRQGQGWRNAARLAADAAAWTDRDVVLGEKYIYAVKAEKADGEGVRSDRVSVRVRHSTRPHGLAADTGGGSVVLTWTPGINANHVQQVVLRKQEGTKRWVRLAHLDTDVDTWTDEEATSGVGYFYRVRSEKANGKGGMTGRVAVVAP